MNDFGEISNQTSLHVRAIKKIYKCYQHTGLLFNKNILAKIIGNNIQMSNYKYSYKCLCLQVYEVFSKLTLKINLPFVPPVRPQ